MAKFNSGLQAEGPAWRDGHLITLALQAKRIGKDEGQRASQCCVAFFPELKDIASDDLSWHLHGWFDVPEGAVILAVNEIGKPILYSDAVTTGGRMILTSLDPFYHHGSHFMPATTRFLDGFLPWLAEDLREVPPPSSRLSGK